jgi:pimeloyl-ACP methyl ester carboxylesterase
MAETIVMIHGMWSKPWVWDNYKKFLEKKGYRCVIPTLRYHDINPKDTPDSRLGTTSLLDYAQDLEKEIGKLGEKPILMGHSMGGLLAQMLGSRGLAKALVLLTPASPAGTWPLTPSVVRSFWSVLVRPNFWKRYMRQKYGEAVYSMMHLLPPEEQKAYYAKFVFESGRAASEVGFWFFDPGKASKVDESKITCPILVIAGKQDRITPAWVVRQVARKYKGTAYKEYPDHAHWVLGEPGWQEVAEYAADWLSETLAKGKK